MESGYIVGVESHTFSSNFSKWWLSEMNISHCPSLFHWYQEAKTYSYFVYCLGYHKNGPISRSTYQKREVFVSKNNSIAKYFL